MLQLQSFSENRPIAWHLPKRGQVKNTAESLVSVLEHQHNLLQVASPLLNLLKVSQTARNGEYTAYIPATMKIWNPGTWALGAAMAVGSGSVRARSRTQSKHVGLRADLCYALLSVSPKAETVVSMSGDNRQQQPKDREQQSQLR
jgi:hypothetical protein